MTVGIVIVVFSHERAARAVSWVSDLVHAFSATKIAIVSNNSKLDPNIFNNEIFSKKNVKVECIFHDNVGAEFGAYEKGLHFLRGSEAVVFSNDTIGSNHFLTKNYIKSFLKSSLLKSNGTGIFLGKLGNSETRFTIEGLKSSRWIRTSLFYMNASALEVINNKMYDPHIDELVRGGASINTFFDKNIDPILQKQLAAWLFSTSGERWYQAEHLTSGNCEKMAAKARAILQERWLSLRLDEGGVAFRPPIMSPRERIVYEVRRKAGF